MKIDFHIHSKYSFDSFMNIEKLIDVARKRGLDGIAITDHNSIKGGLEGIKLNKYQDFRVVCGSEIATDKGEIIGLFLTEDVNSRLALEVIDEIRGQGGISIIAHPYKRNRKLDEEMLRRIDGIEGFNARSSSFENKLAQETAANYNLPMTAGSDAHFYLEVGRGVCIIENASDLEDIRKAIMECKTKIMGTRSSPYLEPMSQVIRAFKSNNPRLLLSNVLLKIISITYKIVKDNSTCTDEDKLISSEEGTIWLKNH